MSVTKKVVERRAQRRLVDRLAELQEGICPICGKPLFDLRIALSLDHVWPRRGKQGQTGLHGNALATHHWCNNAKGDRNPTGCELIWLTAINARLGLEPLPAAAPTGTLADVWPR